MATYRNKTFIIEVSLSKIRLKKLQNDSIPDRLPLIITCIVCWLGSPNNFRGNMSNPNQSSRGSTPNFSFAQHSQRGAPRSEPGMRGGGSYRGAPGFFGTPQENPARPFHHRGHSSNPNYTPRGSFRGNRSRGRPNNPFQCSSFNKNKESDCGNGYFHPEMLENPWQKLEAKSNPSLANTPSAEDISCAKMSDSMIPQVTFNSSYCCFLNEITTSINLQKF